MKKNICALIILLFSSLIFADDIKIKQIFTNGTFSYKTFEEKNEILVIFDKEGTKTKSYSGFEQLKQLKVVEMHNFAFIDDYSFLENLDSVENLYISACTVNDFSFLNTMKGLKTIEFWGYVPEKNQKILEHPIDLSNCKYLETLKFFVANYDKNSQIKFKLPNNNVKVELR